MNKKLLAHKVSKHPLIKRLSEFVDKNTMARLIVEEFMNENKEELEALQGEIQNTENLEDLRDLLSQIDNYNLEDDEYDAIINLINAKKKQLSGESETKQSQTQGS